MSVFSRLNLDKLQFEAGTYIAVFPFTASTSNFMKTVIDNEIPILYFRYIYNSTRRFFLL